ncbi:MAG: helix-turn-helix domain-containing protein [Vicinamibacteria bacterium]
MGKRAVLRQNKALKKEIAQRLRDARRRRGMTQVELAARLGTNQTYVSSVERASRGLTVQQLVRLCRALRISPEEILRETKQSKDNGAISDRRFLRRLQKIDGLSKRQKENLLGTIDAFLKSANVK